MRLRHVLATLLLFAALGGTQASALDTVATGDRWGCVAVDALGGLCLSSPFEQLGL